MPSKDQLFPCFGLILSHWHCFQFGRQSFPVFGNVVHHHDWGTTYSRLWLLWYLMPETWLAELSRQKFRSTRSKTSLPNWCFPLLRAFASSLFSYAAPLKAPSSALLLLRMTSSAGPFNFCSRLPMVFKLTLHFVMHQVWLSAMHIHNKWLLQFWILASALDCSVVVSFRFHSYGLQRDIGE